MYQAVAANIVRMAEIAARKDLDDPEFRQALIDNIEGALMQQDFAHLKHVVDVVSTRVTVPPNSTASQALELLRRVSIWQRIKNLFDN